MTPTLATPPVIGDGIRVNPEQVGAIADVLAELGTRVPPQPATWDDPRFWNVEADYQARCQYLAVGNAINFRFWNLVAGRVEAAEGAIDGISLRGSMYMWRRLRLAVQREELSLDAPILANLDESTFVRAFTDDDGRLPINAGIDQRVLNLRDLGTRLSSNWNGQFANVIRAADGSLDHFVKLSAGFRAFDDPVMKLTMVNAIMLTGSGLACFSQDPLPGIDYHLVRQAIRQGLVVPDEQLRAKLVGRELLDPDEAFALRMAVLDALIQVSEAATTSRAVLDNIYWLNRNTCGEYADCDSCPFQAGCLKFTDYGLPLELTRYY